MRGALLALRPRVLRLVVNWSRIQPQADAPPRWDAPDAGCMRAVGPCAPYASVADQLRAIAALQADGGGRPDVIVTFFYPPPWAVDPPHGCEPRDTPTTHRAVAPRALPAYGELVASLARLATAEHAAVRFWSPWNEPNAGSFLSPQREHCSTGVLPGSPAVYAELARAMRAALATVPGEHRMVLGDLSAAATPRWNLTSVDEFVRGLPRDVICMSDVWAHHQYIGDADLLAPLTVALDAAGCARRKRIWITETGVGGPRPGQPRDTSPAALRAQCRAMGALLARWLAAPRVDVALQYTFREDDLFPTGLASTALDRLYPVYWLWRAWGERAPTGRAPPLPEQCG